MGNDGPLLNVGFSEAVDIKYNIQTQKLWVRNLNGHLRSIDFADGKKTSTLSMVNTYFHKEFQVLSMNLTGTAFTCNEDWNLWTRYGKFNVPVPGTSTSVSTYFMNRGLAITHTYPPASGSNPQLDVNNIQTNQSSPFQNVIYHTNGKLYIGARNGANDAFIFSTDGTTMDRVAGVVGPIGYNALHHGGPALSTSFTEIKQMQQIPSGNYAGDLLVWDNTRLRRVSIATESPAKVYDIINMNIATGASLVTLKDMHYDFNSEISNILGTGTMYYVDGTSAVHKFKANSTLTSAIDTTYDMTGSGIGPSERVRLTLTPDGLLILHPVKSRILRYAP